MLTSNDFQLDSHLIRRRFSASAEQSKDADFLAREISSRMAERLDYIRLAPAHILDLGCGRGADLAELARRYPQATLTGLDFALPLLEQANSQSSWLARLLQRAPPSVQRLCADAHALPLARASIQMVWSNLLLNWLNDPLPVFQECHRVLSIDGLLMFATLGPDTLKELRAALPSHAGERVHRFIDMHDIGDCLIKAGFSDPVMDMQMLTLTYPNADAIFHDLRASASTNAAKARPQGLSGKHAWQAARTALLQAQVNERLPVSIEIIFGHAWKAAPKTTADGRSIIHFTPSR